jgi:hypothetical protein
MWRHREKHATDFGRSRGFLLTFAQGTRLAGAKRETNQADPNRKGADRLS